MGTDFGGEGIEAPDEGGVDAGDLTQWSGLDEDAADLVSKKGFKGQNDLARAYAELEREHGRLRSERDNLVEASGGSEQTKTELAAEWRTLHYVLDGAIPRLIEELGGTSGD